MAKKKKEEQEQADLAVLKATLDRQWSSSSSIRKELDRKWFIYDLFTRGEHYARWDRDTEQILTSPYDDGRPQIVINKTYQTLRAVRNFALRNQPRAEVTPDQLSEEGLKDVKKVNKYLDYLYDRLSLSPKLRGTLWHALKYSVGYWQVMWDTTAANGKGEIDIRVVDPYDLYWDPNATSEEDARYVVLAVRRNLEELKMDDKYDISKEVKGDAKLAASDIKSKLLAADRGAGSDVNPNHKDDGTIIVREHWYKKYKKDGGFDIMICAVAGGEIIRKPEKTELTRFPFFTLHSDIEPLRMYGQGWVKNLIPVNKLLNRLESQVAEYNDLMNRGKWVVDKGAGIKVINNENGQIIEKKRGYDVAQKPIAPLSAVIFQQIQNATHYIEDLGGVHEATAGRIPTGAKSGKAIEALQIGDSNTMSGLIENLEDFLESVYEYVLELASQKYQFARNIIPLSASGEREFIKLIGEGSSNKPEEAVVIQGKNAVDVKITSWLTQTAEARREVLKELYQLQVIDKETLLQGYQIGNVSDILSKAREEQLESAATNIEIEAQGAAAQSQATAEPAPQGKGKLEAIAAIRTILNGGEPQMPENVTPEFIAQIDAFLSSEEAQSLSQDIVREIQMFRDQIAGR